MGRHAKCLVLIPADPGPRVRTQEEVESGELSCDEEARMKTNNFFGKFRWRSQNPKSVRRALVMRLQQHSFTLTLALLALIVLPKPRHARFAVVNEVPRGRGIFRRLSESRVEGKISHEHDFQAVS